MRKDGDYEKTKRLGSILISVISFFALAAVPHIGTEYASAAPAAAKKNALWESI